MKPHHTCVEPNGCLRQVPVADLPEALEALEISQALQKCLLVLCCLDVFVSRWFPHRYLFSYSFNPRQISE